MKKITLLCLTMLCLKGFSQLPSISDRESPSSANINQRITISTELINRNSVTTPAFTMFYFLNTSSTLDGNEIPLNVVDNNGNFILDTNYDYVRSLSPGSDNDENHFPTIPDNLTTGNYFIIWHRVDPQNSNNNRISSRSIFINGVAPAPDLVVTNASVLGSTFTPGQQISVNARVRNQGLQNAGTSTLQYWISSNTTIGNGDEMLATDTVQSLSPNQTSSTESASLTLPSNRFDMQYIIFRADGTDSVDEGVNENNNTVAIPIQIEGDPDLKIDTFNTIIISECSNCSSRLSQLGSNSHRLNTSSSPLQINSIRVQNTGESDAPQSRIAYYISADNKFDNNDIRIGSVRTVNSINDGGFRDISGGSIIASDFPNSVKNNQAFFLLIVVDDNKRVDESNEGNNVAPVRLRISSSAKIPILEPIRGIPLQAKIGPSLLLEQYPIEIYDFMGRKIISKDVSNIMDETDAAMALPTGLYIIKSEKGDRKVHVD